MDGLADIWSSAQTFLGATGWVGNISLGLVAGFMMLMKMRGVGRDDATGQQQASFQERLLKALEASHTRETTMLDRLDRLSRDNEALRTETFHNRVELEMVRNQLRTLAALLRQVRDGVVAPAAILLPDSAGEGGA